MHEIWKCEVVSALPHKCPTLFSTVTALECGPTLDIAACAEELNRVGHGGIVFKIHGCAEKMRQNPPRYRPFMVVTRDDINQWTERQQFQPIREQVRTLLRAKPAVFIGISGQDFNLQAQCVTMTIGGINYPFHQPRIAFTVSSIGIAQRAILTGLYGDQYATHQALINENATLPLYGKRNQLALAETRERQKNETVASLDEIAKTFALPDEMRQREPRAFVTSAINFISRRAEISEKQITIANRVREVLEQAIIAGDAWQKIEHSIEDCVRRQRKAHSIEARMKTDLDSARNLSRAATRAKTRLLEQVFNEKLNKLWRDLFIRLVKDEQFYPRLANPKTVRGSIRTTIEACRESIAPFEQFAAVASSGNLNTAALSLFLSLNLIEQPRHRFLILDDPVQAMDDIHVVQLATLLREIRRQSQRQLILAVHERALFDYLSLQLGPTDPQSSLLTIELDYSTRYRIPEVKAQHRIWRPDKVQFGT